MNISNLATILTLTFVVSVVLVFAELLFILLTRHYFPTSNYSSKKLLNFFCIKYKTRVEPSESPNKKPNGCLPEDPVIDVFKVLEANEGSRVLCTIKEDDDREEVDSVDVLVTKRVSLQECLEAERAAIVVASQCDSPMFFTPVGSPAQDCMS